MKIFSRVFAAVAVVGYGYAGFRAAPIIWDQVGPTVAICVVLSIILTMLIFLHDALFGRSIFDGRR